MDSALKIIGDHIAFFFGLGITLLIVLAVLTLTVRHANSGVQFTQTSAYSTEAPNLFSYIYLWGWSKTIKQPELNNCPPGLPAGSLFEAAQFYADADADGVRQLSIQMDSLVLQSADEFLKYLIDHGHDINPCDLTAEALQNIWIIAQHSSTPEYLSGIYDVLNQPTWRAGSAQQNLGAMFDRIQIDTGKPQKYGTQLRCEETNPGKTAFDLDDPKNVDKRRKEIGLFPLGLQLRLANVDEHNLCSRPQ